MSATAGYDVSVERSQAETRRAPPTVGDVEVEARIADELTRIRQIQHELRVEPNANRNFEVAVASFVPGSAAGPQDVAASGPSGPSDPASTLPDAPLAGAEHDHGDVAPILRLLRAAQTALLRHPNAASFVFQALVDEGRRFAKSHDGADRAAALATDPTMAEMRRLWEATSLNVLTADSEQGRDHRLPSGWIDLLLDAAAASSTDILLDGLGPASDRQAP